jgi:hypothetical protein
VLDGVDTFDGSDIATKADSSRVSGSYNRRAGAARAVKEDKHPSIWTLALGIWTGVALLVGLFGWRRMYETRNKSLYSRLVKGIADYFGTTVPS